MACDFPELKLILSHAGYPWVLEACLLAWKHPNVYLELAAHRPKYFTAPGTGWEPLLRFGQTTIQDKILYGTGAFLIGRAPRRAAGRVPRPAAAPGGDGEVAVAQRRARAGRAGVSGRVLLTGGTGLVGSSIAQALVAAGRSVRAVVRSRERGQRVLPAAVELVEGDVTDPASLHRAVDGCAVVYHAAGLPEQWLPDPSIFQRVNVQGHRAT